MRGFLVGALGLVALQVLASTKGINTAVGGAFGVVSKGVASFLSAGTPAFKAKATTTAATTSTATAAAATYPAITPAPNQLI